MIRSTAAAGKAISSSIGFRTMGRRCRVSSQGAVVGVKDQSSCDLKDSYSQHPYLKKYSHLILRKLCGYAQAQNTSMRFPFVLLSVTVLLACIKAPTSAERSEKEAPAERREEEASPKGREEEASPERSQEEASGERSEEEVRLLYEEWFLKYRKSAKDLDEKESRFQVFRDNLKGIDKHNAAADAGEHTYWQGINCFSDLTLDEINSMFSSGLRTEVPRRFDFSSKLLRNPAKLKRVLEEVFF